jgi:hypothetical protein
MSDKRCPLCFNIQTEFGSEREDGEARETKLAGPVNFRRLIIIMASLGWAGNQSQG